MAFFFRFFLLLIQSYESQKSHHFYLIAILPCSFCCCTKSFTAFHSVLNQTSQCRKKGKILIEHSDPLVIYFDAVSIAFHHWPMNYLSAIPHDLNFWVIHIVQSCKLLNDTSIPFFKKKLVLFSSSNLIEQVQNLGYFWSFHVLLRNRLGIWLVFGSNLQFVKRLFSAPLRAE